MFFKQTDVLFNHISRHFFIFRFLFKRTPFCVYNGKKSVWRRISSYNLFFFRFGDFSLSKRHGPGIHYRNKTKKLAAQRKKVAIFQLKKTRRLLQQKNKLKKKFSVTLKKTTKKIKKNFGSLKKKK